MVGLHAYPATASYVCSTLRPVIPDPIVLRHVWPELADIGLLRMISIADTDRQVMLAKDRVVSPAVSGRRP